MTHYAIACIMRINNYAIEYIPEEGLLLKLNAKKIAQSKGINVEMVANVLGITSSSAAEKLNGSAPLTVMEAFKLRDTLFPEYSLDYLFSPEDDT